MASVYKKKIRVRDPKTGQKVTTKSKKWWIKFRNFDGKVKRVPGFTDKAATMQMATKLEREAALRKVGVFDCYEEHRKRPLSEHLDAYKLFMEAKENSDKHVYQVATRTQKVIRGCKFVFPSDVSPSAVQVFVASLRKKGRSAQTSNFYLQAMKQFMNWMVKDRRVPDNPLRILSPVNVRKDRRHDRRALVPEELARLIEAANEGKAVEGMKGPVRGMMYLFSAFTGLRRKELASLKIGSLDLNSESPTVVIAAAYSKNGRADKIPLHPIVAQTLQQWIEVQRIGPTDFIFPLRTPNGEYRRTSKMMKRDLKIARERWIKEAEKEPEVQAERTKSDFLSYRNQEGLFADFHSNRHTFISNLSRAGVHPKLAQILARHSTINLTMNVYTHMGMDEKARAVRSIPGPISARPNREAPNDLPKVKENEIENKSEPPE